MPNYIDPRDLQGLLGGGQISEAEARQAEEAQNRLRFGRALGQLRGVGAISALEAQQAQISRDKMNFGRAYEQLRAAPKERDQKLLERDHELLERSLDGSQTMSYDDYQRLKGGGHITEIEGERLEAMFREAQGGK